MNKGLIKIMAIAGVTALVASAAIPANAADKDPSKVASKSNPQALTGKVVSVDTVRKSVVIEINNRVFAFRLNPKLELTVDNQPATLKALAPGQEVTIVARRAADARFEIVALNIDSKAFVAEAAGREGHAKGKGMPPGDKGGYGLPGPTSVQSPPPAWRSEPNPANISGGLHSPHK